MALKITGPLFATEAYGTIKKVGTFRRQGSFVFLTSFQFGKEGNDNANPALKECFAVAKDLHGKLPREWNYWNGKWGFHLTPHWPEFWNAFLDANPACKL